MSYNSSASSSCDFDQNTILGGLSALSNTDSASVSVGPQQLPLSSTLNNNLPTMVGVDYGIQNAIKRTTSESSTSEQGITSVAEPMLPMDSATGHVNSAWERRRRKSGEMLDDVDRRRERQRQCKRDSRNQMDPEKLDEIRRKNRERVRERRRIIRMLETEQEAASRKERQRVQQQIRRLTATEEQQALNRQKARERQRLKRSVLPSEEKDQVKQRDKQRRQMRRRSITTEQQRVRHNEQKRQRRVEVLTQNPDVVELERLKNRERMRVKRLREKLERGGVDCSDIDFSALFASNVNKALAELRNKSLSSTVSSQPSTAITNQPDMIVSQYATAPRASSEFCMASSLPMEQQCLNGFSLPSLLPSPSTATSSSSVAALCENTSDNCFTSVAGDTVSSFRPQYSFCFDSTDTSG